MDRRMGAVVAALVVVVLALAGWETFDDPARRPPKAHPVALADGFHVAAGSRLVGAVFPRPPGVAPEDPGGWSALLDVDGDAVTVFNAYAEQARRLGYRRTPATAENPCSARGAHVGPVATTTSVAGQASGPVEEVQCSAGYFRDDGRGVTVELRVCSTCETPVSAARITTSAGTTPVSAPVAAIVNASVAPSLRLDPGQHRRAWATTATHADAGTRALSPEVSFDGCDTDAHTVLEVTGAPDHVFDAYVAKRPPAESGTTVRARFGEDDVVSFRSRRGIDVTLLRSPRLRRPLLAVDVCYSSPG